MFTNLKELSAVREYNMDVTYLYGPGTISSFPDLTGRYIVNSSFSDFTRGRVFNSLRHDGEEHMSRDLRKRSLEVFTRLITDRIAYLAGLVDLGDDWVSGTSFAPNEFSLERSKSLLLKLLSLINENQHLPIPKLIMGPIPAGGMGISLSLAKRRSISISIFNDEKIDLEFELDGCYDEVALTVESSLEVALENLLNRLAD